MFPFPNDDQSVRPLSEDDQQILLGLARRYPVSSLVCALSGLGTSSRASKFSASTLLSNTSAPSLRWSNSGASNARSDILIQPFWQDIPSIHEGDIRKIPDHTRLNSTGLIQLPNPSRDVTSHLSPQHVTPTLRTSPFTNPSMPPPVEVDLQFPLSIRSECLMDTVGHYEGFQPKSDGSSTSASTPAAPAPKQRQPQTPQRSIIPPRWAKLENRPFTPIGGRPESVIRDDLTDPDKRVWPMDSPKFHVPIAAPASPAIPPLDLDTFFPELRFLKYLPTEDAKSETQLEQEVDAASRCQYKSNEGPQSDLVSTPEKSVSSGSTRSMSQDPRTLVDETCATILSTAFGITIDEVPEPTSVWQSVQTCLAELSEIIDPSLELPCHREYAGQSGRAPCPPAQDGATSSAPRSSQKRKPSGTGLDGDNPEDNLEASDSNGGLTSQDCDISGSKRRKKTTHFSCPFRKRNPLRFHVRDHMNCATQSFSSISQVKRHVMTFHKRKAAALFVCTRCQERFTTSQDCQAHLRAPPDRICQTKDPGDNSSSEDDPEDGITSEIEEVLRDRRAHIQVVDWDALWRTLFPKDSTIESAEFEPVIEDYEVQHDFNECSGEWQSLLRAEAIRMPSNSTQASTDKLHALFQTLISRTLQGCRSRVLCSYARTSRRRQRTAEGQSQAAASSRSSSTLATHQRRLLPTPDSTDQRSPPPPSSTTSRPVPTGIDESWHQNVAQPQATDTSNLDPSQFGGGVLPAAAVHQYDISNVINQWPDVCVFCQGPGPCDCDRGFDPLGFANEFCLDDGDK